MLTRPKKPTLLFANTYTAKENFIPEQLSHPPAASKVSLHKGFVGKSWDSPLLRRGVQIYTACYFNFLMRMP